MNPNNIDFVLCKICHMQKITSRNIAKSIVGKSGVLKGVNPPDICHQRHFH